MSWSYEECHNQEVRCVSPVIKFHLHDKDKCPLKRIVLAVVLNQPVGSIIRMMTPTYFYLALVFDSKENSQNYHEKIKSSCKKWNEHFISLALYKSREYISGSIEYMDFSEVQPECLNIRFRDTTIIKYMIEELIILFNINKNFPIEYYEQMKKKIEQVNL